MIDDPAIESLPTAALTLVDSEFDRQRLDCQRCLDRARASMTGDPDRAVSEARAGLGRARSLKGPSHAAREVAGIEAEANLVLAEAVRSAGDLPAADAALDEAEGLLNTRAAGSDLHARLHLLRGLVASDSRDFPAARDHFATAARVARRNHDGDRLSAALVLQALAECRGGEPEAGLWHLEQGLEKLRVKNRSALVVAAAFALVDCLGELGFLIAAFDLANRLEKLLGALGFPVLTLRARWKRALVEYRLGRLRDAEQGLRVARDGLTEHGRFAEAALVSIDLAEHYLEQQRHPDLRQLAEEMFPVFVARGVSPGVRDALVRLRDDLSGARVDREELARLRDSLQRSRRDRTHRL